jgi:hypothetical protein
MRVKLSVLAAVALAGVVAAAPPALAGDTECVGVVSGVHDNIVVPPGAFCLLEGPATVKGNVKVLGPENGLPGGQLLVDGFLAPVTVRGNIQSDGGEFVGILGSSPLIGVAIGGSVQIKKATAVDSGYFSVSPGGVRIRGNFEYEENEAFLVATGANIRGNLKAQKNTGGGEITENVIGGNLECKENVPEMVQAGNTVGGNLKCPEE